MHFLGNSVLAGRPLMALSHSELGRAGTRPEGGSVTASMSTGTDTGSTPRTTTVASPDEKPSVRPAPRGGSIE